MNKLQVMISGNGKIYEDTDWNGNHYRGICSDETWKISEEEEKQLAKKYTLLSKELGLEKYYVSSDRAGILIGTEEDQILIFNRAGRDGTTTVLIDPSKKLTPDDIEDVTRLDIKDADLNLYDNDCHAKEEYALVTLAAPVKIYRIWDIVIIQPVK